MIDLAPYADPDLKDAVLGWLRNPHTEFKQLDGHGAADAADSFWSDRLAGVVAPPAWRDFGTVTHPHNPIAVVTGQIPGQPGLHVLAAALHGADRPSVSLATARRCHTEPGRYEISPLTWLSAARELARALTSSIVDGDIDHAHCQPAHEHIQAGRLNLAEPQRRRAALPDSAA